MRARLEKRRDKLRAEFNAGGETLAELARERSNLESVLLRIRGAADVLAEESAAGDGADADAELGARVQERLAELRREIEDGVQRCAALDARRDELEASLLRTSGAIQVLEEILGAAPAAEGSPADAVPPSTVPSS